jgi:AraC-like DNA-binding protein
MLLKDFLPSPVLREYVSTLFILHFTFSAGDVLFDKAYSPRPENCLCFYPRDPEYVTYPGESQPKKRPPVYLIGQHTVLTRRTVGRDFLAIFVSFQPGALLRLTGIPSWELTNTYQPAEEVLSKEVHLVNERLYYARSYPEMLATVEAYLIQLIKRSRQGAHGIDKAAQLLLRGAAPSVHWLAQESCLSPKQFERKFKERTGINASLLARIARFHESVKLKNTRPDLDWLDIALTCGYFDYQHLARDCKDFTGLTPPAFSRLDGQAPERQFGLQEFGLVE